MGVIGEYRELKGGREGDRGYRGVMGDLGGRRYVYIRRNDMHTTYRLPSTIYHLPPTYYEIRLSQLLLCHCFHRSCLHAPAGCGLGSRGYSSGGMLQCFIECCRVYITVCVKFTVSIV